MVFVLPRPGIFITGIEINFGNNIGLAPSKIYASVPSYGGITKVIYKIFYVT